MCFGREGSAPTATEAARSWSIYLTPVSERTCRLAVRGRVLPPKDPSLAARLAAMLEQPTDFLMEQRMLRTLKRLVEGSPGTS